jgi:hypothetical protein
MTTTASLWTMGAGWRLWRFELNDRMAILMAVCRFLGMVLQTLVLCALIAMSACIISLVDLLMFVDPPFDVFGGMCGEILCNVFLPLFMVLGVPIFPTL